MQTKNLNFPLKKGDSVKTECGFTGKIIKYSSNKEIMVEDQVSLGAIDVFEKGNIIEVNGVPTSELVKIKPVYQSTTSVQTKSGVKITLTANGWMLKNEKGENMMERAILSSLNMAKYLKQSGVKPVNIHIFPQDTLHLIFGSVASDDLVSDFN